MTQNKRRITLLSGCIAAALVAGAATFTAVTASENNAAPAPAQAGTQAATLSQLVSNAGTTVTRHDRRTWLARLRAVGGMHGQFTFRTARGTRTLAFERGSITSVTSSVITVRAADGTLWAWQLTAKTAVRDEGAKAAPTALATGDNVFVAGPVVGGDHDARLIAIPLSVQ